MATAAASPLDADDVAFDPPLASTRTLTPASSPSVTTAPTNNSDICLICLETLTPQPTPTSSTSSLSEPLLAVASVADAPRPTLVAIATQPPTATCGCKYRVHPACLQAWFAHQPVCPLCRTGVNTGTSTDGPRTPGADEGSPPRTTRTLVVWRGEQDSPPGSEDTSAQDEMDREDRGRCTFCHRLLCVLAGVFLAYIVISVLSVHQDAWPDGVNGTAS